MNKQKEMLKIVGRFSSIPTLAELDLTTFELQVQNAIENREARSPM